MSLQGDEILATVQRARDELGEGVELMLGLCASLFVSLCASLPLRVPLHLSLSLRPLCLPLRLSSPASLCVSL